MISFPLEMKKHQLLFVNFEFVKKLESRGKSIVVIDEGTEEKLKFTQNLWEVWKGYFERVFGYFSKPTLDIISKFCVSDDLQSRLLLQIAKNHSFEQLIRETPFFAYLELMSDYLFQKFGESNLGNNIKKNMSFYKKLTPNSLNFRYFGFFNSLIENEKVKNSLNNLNEIDLERIFYEKQGSLEFKFPSRLDQSNNYLKINVSSGIVENKKEFSRSGFIYGIGAKLFYNYLIFGIHLHFSEKFIPNRLFFLTYFGCLRGILLDLEKKEALEKIQLDESSFCEFLFPDENYLRKLFYFKFIKNFSENSYELLISKEIGDRISSHSNYHASDVYIKEINKFKDFFPDFIFKIIESVYMENSKFEYFGRRQDPTNLDEYKLARLNFSTFDIYEQLNDNLNLMEISNQNLKLALLIFSYFKKKEKSISAFDKYRITSWSKSDILKEIIEDDEVRKIILKFSINSILQIHFDDLIYIAKNGLNRKLINSLPEVSLLIADLMFNSAKNGYDNLTKRLVLQLYHYEKNHADLRKKYIDSGHEDEEIENECQDIDNILSPFLFQYTEVSDSLPKGRMIESVEMIDEIINAGYGNTEFAEHFEFPEPPFPGTAYIIPIRYSTDLFEEGKEQLNCCYTYVDRVMTNRYYFYRCNKYERFTIGIVWNEELSLWEIDEISSKGNKRPKKKSLEFIKKWFNSELSK
ncbi:hypothetical protein [Leptospira levettii]|uniref:hypothetical protein n=1 Tax=Leptospira levettii TaxID=2023178 RepID=UPI001A9C610D|nr:hypothetical protein [Leptospira levettii]